VAALLVAGAFLAMPIVRLIRRKAGGKDANRDDD